ncbi:MAG: ABC transporter permease [Pseudonocardia sp.]|nr:ABC transporter permease [Pseudonocardia sp.]
MGYVVRRVLTGLGTMAFVLVFNFFLFRLLPGDPISLYTRGRNMDREQLRELRRELNRPVGEQFLGYLANPFSSGVDSTQFSRPVWDVIGDYVWPTLVLLVTATALSAIIGIAIGIKGGWRRGSTFDRTSTGVTLTLYAMPEFWLGMVLLILFSTGVGVFPGVFPSGGTLTPGIEPWSVEGVLDQAWHLTLPALTLTLAYLAEYALVMRSSLLDEVRQDYLVTARAKGLMDKLVRRRHAVPNALLPTITLVFLNIGFVVSGAITVETVFSWPGLGLLSYQAIRGPDIPLLQAIFLLFSLAVVVANIVADVAVAALDPRVRT